MSESLRARQLRQHRLDPAAPIADVDDGVAFIVTSGVVMASGKSSLPTLTEAIVGHPIKGSWMAAPEVQRIYDLWHAIDARPEVTSAPLVQGKQVYVAAELSPSVAAIAADPDRRDRAVVALKPLERRLYDTVVDSGEVRVDEWTQISLLTTSQVRTARTKLAALFLVSSEELHTDAGYHTVVLRPFVPAPSPLPFTDATRELLLAALRSCVIADAKEVRKWNDWSSLALDALIDDGAVAMLDENTVAEASAIAG